MPLSLKVGDKAVYAAHGVGEVLAVERREIHGRSQAFYVLRLAGSGTTVLVPTEKARGSGLRSIIPRAEVKKVLALLRHKESAPPRQPWNRRHRAYMDKLQRGSIFEVAEVLRELSVLQSTKPLSYSERRVLTLARSLLVHELAQARSTQESLIEKELDAIFSPSSLGAARTHSAGHYSS